MIIYIALIAALVLIKSKICRGLNESYIDKDGCNAVKGIFILMIFASHFYKYVDAYQTPLDTAYWWFRVALGQCVVSMFLFYSGYGVMLSGVKRGRDYIKRMPEKRILRTLLVWMLSQVIFLAVQVCLGKRYSLGNIAGAFFSIKSMGNDNWYIMDILLLYAISFVAFIRYKSPKQVVLFTWIATVGMIAVLYSIKKGTPYYNTLLCYPLGCTYVLIKDFVEKKMNKTIPYLGALAVAIALYLVAHKFWHIKVVYMLTAVMFCVVVLLVTMRVKIGNRVLRYCGEHLQGLFLIHRLPMLIFQKVPLISSNNYVYFAVSVVCAFLLEFVFHKTVQFLQNAVQLKAES